MLRCKAEEFKSSIKLVDSMRMETKETLKEIAKLLGISISAKLRKEEYAEGLAYVIVAFPQEWLPGLTRFELLLLKKLVEAGPNAYVEEKKALVPNTLETLGMLIADYSMEQQGLIRFMIYDELRNAIAPYLDEILASKEQMTRNTIEQYACGVLNLYGLMEFGSLLDLLNDCLKVLYTKEEIYRTLQKSIQIERHTLRVVGPYTVHTLIQSPFLNNPEELDARLAQRPEMNIRRSFSLQEMLDAGSMPVPQIPIPSSAKLKSYMMNRLKYSEASANFQLLFLWGAMQAEGNPISFISPIIGDKLSSRQELQEAVNLFMEYINQCPRWFLRGYSSQETFELHEKDKLRKNPPQLVAGPNMKAAGMNITPDLQKKFNTMFRDTFSDKKVGRNDPCPCGSGKKHKHCCG